MKPIASLADIPDGRLKLVRSGSREFLVYRKGETVAVCGNVCPHHGAHLCDGAVYDGVLTCPRHHARFDIVTGSPVSPPALDGITVYESDVIDGDVCVGRPVSSMPAPVEIEGSPHYVIVGAGAAGIGCAEALRRGSFTGRITVLSEELSPPYDRTLLSTEYLIGQSAKGLLLRDPDLHRALGVEVLVGERAERVDRATGTVVCVSGRTVKYDKLLLALGAVPRRLGVPGEDLEGIHSLRTIKDADALRAALAEGDSGLIVGAGFLGLEVAFSLSSFGANVSVVAPEQHPLEAQFGRAFSDRLIRMMKDAGITWMPGTSVRELVGDGSIVRATLEDHQTIDATTVVVAAGITTAGLPEGLAELTDNHGMIVDRRFCTADPDIYAAGDMLAGESHAGHWVTAMRQGWYVGQVMLGTDRPYRDPPFFWSDLPGGTVRAVGHPSGTAPVAVHGSIEVGEFLAIWQYGERTTGAFAVGYDAELIEIEHALFNEQVTE
jgi:apoptosis-inducing factor 3